MINGVLTQIYLSVPMGPQTHLLVISPILECIIEIGILRSWQNPHNLLLNIPYFIDLGAMVVQFSLPGMPMQVSINIQSTLCLFHLSYKMELCRDFQTTVSSMQKQTLNLVSNLQHRIMNMQRNVSSREWQWSS